MYSISSLAEATRPFLTWQPILDWAESHYRCRDFQKDEKIPTRAGLLYLVQRGAVRLVATSNHDATTPNSASSLAPIQTEESFLGFIGPGEPFEIITQPPFTLASYAHIDQTSVLWMYWQDFRQLAPFP